MFWVGSYVDYLLPLFLGGVVIHDLPTLVGAAPVVALCHPAAELLKITLYPLLISSEITRSSAATDSQSMRQTGTSCHQTCTAVIRQTHLSSDKHCCHQKNTAVIRQTQLSSDKHSCHQTNITDIRQTQLSSEKRSCHMPYNT